MAGKTALLAVVSDLHTGSTVGLCGPDPVVLDDGGEYHPSKAQAWLWQNWQAYWQRVAEARKNVDWFGILINGDLCDGDHHGTYQIISRDPAVQSWILRDISKPWLALKPDQVIIVRGTEVHAGQLGHTEEAFARWLKREGVTVPKEAVTGMYSHWHFRGDICGHLLDATHHGRVGTRPWTERNVVMNLAAQVFYEHAKMGQPHPELAIRSHYHRWADTYDAHPVRLIQTPAWQLATSYAHRVVPESLADIGGVLVRLDRDRPVQVEPILYRAQRAPTVKLV